MNNRRESYVKRACSRCKEKKIKCVKEDGSDCKACIEKEQECVPQGEAKKRGPKPRSSALSSKSSEMEIKEHPQNLSRLSQLSENGHKNKRYQLFMTEMTMINGDNGGYYESGQNPQLLNRAMDSRASTAIPQDDVDPQRKLLESFMINGGNSPSNVYPTQQDDSQYITEFLAELNNSSTMEAMPQKHFEQTSKDTSFHLKTPESIQNGLPQVEDHNDIVQVWDAYWTNHLKEKELF